MAMALAPIAINFGRGVPFAYRQELERCEDCGEPVP
jgi:hypothetical protein